MYSNKLDYEKENDDMRELFEQNRVLFLAVITVLIIAFLIKKLIDYITRKGLRDQTGRLQAVCRSRENLQSI